MTFSNADVTRYCTNFTKYYAWSKNPFCEKKAFGVWRATVVEAECKKIYIWLCVTICSLSYVIADNVRGWCIPNMTSAN